MSQAPWGATGNHDLDVASDTRGPAAGSSSGGGGQPVEHWAAGEEVRSFRDGGGGGSRSPSSPAAGGQGRWSLHVPRPPVAMSSPAQLAVGTGDYAPQGGVGMVSPVHSHRQPGDYGRAGSPRGGQVNRPRMQTPGFGTPRRKLHPNTRSDEPVGSVASGGGGGGGGGGGAQPRLSYEHAEQLVDLQRREIAGLRARVSSLEVSATQHTEHQHPAIGRQSPAARGVQPRTQQWERGAGPTATAPRGHRSGSGGNGSGHYNVSYERRAPGVSSSLDTGLRARSVGQPTPARFSPAQTSPARTTGFGGGAAARPSTRGSAESNMCSPENTLANPIRSRDARW